MNNPHQQHPYQGSFPGKTVIAIAIGALAIIVLFMLWSASDVLLLAFAAILVAVFLRGLSDRVSKYARLSHTWSLASVVIGIVLVSVIGVWFLAPRVAAQSDQLSKGLTQSVQRLGEELRKYDPGQRIIGQTPSLSELTKRTNLLSQVTGIFSATLSGVANAVIIGFIGLYLAADPSVYVNGMLRLLPEARRQRVADVLGETYTTLYSWLMGRVFLMAVNGLMTSVGLWLLGIPMALTLGILAGLLNFIPNIGPIIAGVPAVLIGWTQGPTTALYVFLLYLFLQSLDGYVFTPLVQQKTVSMPPALTIFAQLLLGVLAGGTGLLLATPLMAAILVLIKRFYVEDVLGNHDIETTNHDKSG